MAAAEQEEHFFQYLSIEGSKCIVHCTDGHTLQITLSRNVKIGLAADQIVGTCNEQGIEGAYHDDIMRQYITALGDCVLGKAKNQKKADEQQPGEKLQISTVEWQLKLEEKLNQLRVVVDTIPNLWHSLEFVLSVKMILNIDDITLPFAGIILGAPSSNKTVAIEMFRKWPQTFYTDKFTSKSFVSHSTAVTKENLADIDLLPKIKDKFFLTPELGPLFTTRDDDLVENLGILARVLDGRGYQSVSGAHGQRGYEGEWMFVQVGAAVDIPRKVYKYLGMLGPKLYFIRVPRSKKTEAQYFDQLRSNDFEKKKAAIEETLMDYLKWFEASPAMQYKNKLPKMSWDSSKDDIDAVKLIIKLGKLLAHLRGVIPTWETHDPQSQGAEYAYSLAIKEEPDRAMQQLYNLARGHALVFGRNYITREDLTIVIKVVLSTAMMERVKVFDLLVKHGGKLTTSQIVELLNTTSPTARRTMTEFKALGLVNMQSVKDEDNNSVYAIELKSEFQWFLEDEFQKLRHGFELAEEQEKTSPREAERDPVTNLFIQICGEIQEDSSDHSIERIVLHRNLVSSGKFDAGPATQMILDCVKAGYLEELQPGTYRLRAGMR